MKYDYLHESETVCLHANTPRPCNEVVSVLEELGFTLHEDIFTLDRAGSIPPWESSSWVHVDFFLGEKEIYDLSAQWDTIKLVYLLATIPREGISKFVASASRLSMSLGVPMTYKDRVVTEKELEAALNDCADELEREVADPGSETVAIFIESTYPRTR